MKSFSQKTNIFPLNEWLYFRLSTEIGNQDKILIELNKFIHTFYNQKKLEKFFFVRYFTEFHELRIRLKFDNKENKIVEVLLTYFESLFNAGVLKDFSINIYRREIERYGVKFIDDFETLFSIDSLAITKFLTIYSKTEDRLIFSLMYLNRLIELLPYSEDKKYEILENNAKRYRRISIDNNNTKSSISKAFRHYRPIIESSFNNQKPLFNTILNINDIEYERTLKRIYNESNVDINIQLINILHMHNNRLFRINQKYFDILTFEFLYRFTKSKRARERTSKRLI